MKRLPIRTTVIPDVIPTVILNLIQNLPTKIAGQARNDDYPGSPLNLTRTKTRI